MVEKVISSKGRHSQQHNNLRLQNTKDSDSNSAASILSLKEQESGQIFQTVYKK